MAGAYFLYNDNIVGLNAALAVSNTGAGTSLASATLPLANLTNRAIAKAARIVRSGTDAASVTTITASGMLDASAGFVGMSARAIAIIGEKWTAASGNIYSPQATWRIKVYNSFNGLIHDSGAGGLFASAQPGYPPILLYVFPTLLAAAKVECSFTIASAPDSPGNLDIGRIFLCNVIELTDGVDAEIVISSADNARVTRSRGGQIIAETVPKWRVLAFKVSHVPEQLAINTLSGGAGTPSFQSMGIQVGTSGEVLVVPRTTDEHVKRRLSIYGRLTRVPSIIHTGGGYYSVQFDAEEGL